MRLLQVRVLVGRHCKLNSIHHGSKLLLAWQPPDKGWVKLNTDDASKEMHVSIVLTVLGGLVWASGFQISSGFAQCSKSRIMG